MAFALLLGACDLAPADEPSPGTSAGTETGEPQLQPQCDPLDRRSFCEAGEVVQCGPDGLFEVTSCGTNAACAEGTDGAECVWRLGEACDGDIAPTCWDPGGVLRCEDGFWTFEGCDPDARCKQDSGDAACIPQTQPDCEYADFEPRCEGDVLIECGLYAVETSTVCAPETRCAPTLDGVACIPDDAVQCDPNAFERQCLDEGVVQTCDPATGWTQDTACSDEEHCLSTTMGGFCLPQELETCDPGAVEPSCTDGVARGCSSLGVAYEEVCAKDQRCAIDESWFFDGERHATCIPLDAEPCTEPTDLLCDGDILHICFDGAQVLGIECPVCSEDPEQLDCS